MKARIRVLCALVCFSAPTLSGCALENGSSPEEGAEAVAQALSADIAVYTNASLAAPWRDWSWSTTVVLTNADAPLASGSASQIRVTSSTAGGALALAYASGDLTASDYDAIAFDVRGPTSGSVRLAVETLAGAGGGAQATIPVTTAWTRQTIKLAALRGTLTKFGKVQWISAQSGQTFYLDNVKLVAPVGASSPPPPATTVPPAPVVPPSPTFPTVPLAVTRSTVVAVSSAAARYSLYVPATYDATHRTPTKVLLWLHGCGGNAYGDAWTVSPGGGQSWITVSVGGRDGGCWNVDTDVPLALAALDDVERRLNVDRRRVVIGGYSSGGDMAYRTAFFNARRFAGVVAENTSPFRDSGSSQTSSIAAAAWKLNIAHLAHVGDTLYRIDAVRAETDALKNAGFPVIRIERPGTHWDADTATSGTARDLRAYLLGYLDAGWLSPP